jgi:glyoxylase-like metal-dependent hydrolase (beta-lactamase superfamily II)
MCTTTMLLWWRGPGSGVREALGVGPPPPSGVEDRCLLRERRLFSVKPVLGLSDFSDGDTLGVPGRPRVIHTPGHTDGSTWVLLDNRGVILTGDSLVTMHPGSGRTGARVMPGAFNRNSAQALESSEHLHGIEVATVLPGHGEPWTGGLPAPSSRPRRLTLPSSLHDERFFCLLSFISCHMLWLCTQRHTKEVRREL